ncbi:MAG: hypothetical protein B7Y12_11740 [Rhizobiales bacterium 24-66-13]|nr:MAG: hypothetical protein B7Y12_11740 [Rhizobiales bacterium 24-66-13]OZB07073.1 MAG: hypothetical protein B7X67_09460 [Rhizobiales bacterium 39-66-18]
MAVTRAWSGRRTPPRGRDALTRIANISRTPTALTEIRADLRAGLRVSCPAQIACHEDFRP